MGHAPQYPQNYAMLSDGTAGLRPPPQRGTVPKYHPPKSGRRNCCLRCVCCCFCFWILLIVLLGSLALLIFTFLQPQMPSYNVDRFQVHAFDMEPDFSHYMEVAVTVKANNPNAHIGLIYGKGNSVSVEYQGETLCSGILPAFHQPPENITKMNLVLKGKGEFGSGLQEALTENRNKGNIPLLVKVQVPISVVLQDIPLRKVVVSVNCSLVVDNLAPNKEAKIVSAKYNYEVGF